ncbi:HTH Tnp Tc3 2 domain containing protein [Asbolus verrucosus]|uniref:HTH Tnp Tc3 2 domain containing protein n=1 Tax=Asbolus verrucosus TaxID=1661398 RepID=A0A482V890_ASBVE|nr:HTH Tnp Tc3 2 domain containing protein [Asbolus verrucosus]
MLSEDTIRRRLAKYQLTSKIPARGPLLTRDHCRSRLTFAQNHVNWRNEDWRRVLFLDESRFCLYHSDRRVQIY